MKFDIVVWIDEDEDIVAQAYSPDAHEFFRSLDNSYHDGDIVQVFVSPDEFVERCPAHLRIGTQDFVTKIVSPMTPSHLH